MATKTGHYFYVGDDVFVMRVGEDTPAGNTLWRIRGHRQYEPERWMVTDEDFFWTRGDLSHAEVYAEAERHMEQGLFMTVQEALQIALNMRFYLNLCKETFGIKRPSEEDLIAASRKLRCVRLSEVPGELEEAIPRSQYIVDTRELDF